VAEVEAAVHVQFDFAVHGHVRAGQRSEPAVAFPAARLEAVLGAYPLIAHESHGHHDAELASLLHRDERVVRAERHLGDMVRGLLADAAASGDVRGDVTLDELATYSLHAIGAASGLPSKAAVRRLVAVTLAGWRPHGVNSPVLSTGT
jgi:hypothetical protein